MYKIINQSCYIMAALVGSMLHGGTAHQILSTTVGLDVLQRSGLAGPIQE